jgi:acyl phosphate:glycerol-3-phosphate acyltransferase
VAILLTVAFSYLLGSIPFGYLLIRMFHGEDIRQTGSGNIGATNVSRTSPALGAVTLVLDALKGLAAVAITRTLFPGQVWLAMLAALCSILGHAFPLWLKFRGGKGVATGLGSFVLITPKAILVAVAVFVAIVSVLRYVSLGSLIAVSLLPLLAWMLDGYRDTPWMIAPIAVASLLIIGKHHENIRRLLNGTENKLERG